ncbi:hypothetical protein SKAU_G00276800 [Synaphobranchus kaupii]|uniref:Uncharacterized protein n=1 Tax=Synaphobranchus kaupii TaxID=118154 RepID=A0A9Q1F1R8_SYNKA|nr:hypothetical protein SKAU_G00276800 [Synaphobranchus kaupii]
MGKFVRMDQMCGVPGRSCTWNLMLTRDVLDWAEDRNLPLALALDPLQAGVQLGACERLLEQARGARSRH